MAEIKFDFLADTSDLEAGQERAADGFDSVGDSATQFAKGAGLAVAAVTAAVVAGAAAVKKLAAETLKLSAAGNEAAKTAAQFGTTAAEIQRVDGALALLTDGSVRAGVVARFLGKNLADARSDGIGPAAEALERLGLTAEEVIALPLSQQIELIGSKFGGLSDNAEQTQVAMDLMGRAGTKLIPVFSQGAGAFADAADEIERVGIISNELAAQAEVLADEWELFGRQVDSVTRQAVAPAVPVMAALLKITRELVNDFVGSESLSAAAERVALSFREHLIPAFLGITLAVKNYLTIQGTVEAALVRFGASFLGTARGIAKAITFQFDDAKEAIDAAVLLSKAGADELAAIPERLRQNAVDVANLGFQAGAVLAGPGAAATADDPAAAVREEAEAKKDAVVKAKKEEVDKVLEEEARLWEALQKNREREIFLEAQSAERRVAIREDSSQEQIQGANALFGALKGLVDAGLQAEIQATGSGSAERKRLLKQQFRVNKITAVAQGAVNTALAASNAFASAGNPVIGAALAALATGVGIAQTIAIGAKPEPQFHRGASSVAAPDEFGAMLRAKEAVSNPQGADILGRENIERANRGEATSQTMNVILKLNNRALDASTYEQTRRPGSSLSEFVRTLQPTPVGAARVW